MAAGDGLVTMTPTSIVVAGAGSSASINSDGGVDFTSATSLSLNGVFTSSFDNYLIVVVPKLTILDNYEFRLRAAGTNSTSGYAFQRLYASGTTAAGYRTTGASSIQLNVDTTDRNGLHIHLYGPALSQATAFRSVGMYANSGAILDDNAGTHSTASSYDGFSLAPASGSSSGNIVVFGYEE